jgi:flavin-dependent dehydrogenase
LDKSAFPRFHIGESMLPYLTKAFEVLGVLGDIEPHFMHKLGAELAESDGSARTIDFKMLHPGQWSLAFNLDRIRSDAVLLHHAEQAGVHVRQQAEVTGLTMDGPRVAGVEYAHEGSKHSARASFVIDASGRAGVVARRLRLRKMNQRLRHVGVYQFYEHLDPRNNPSRIEDAVFSYYEGGWVWCFPVTVDRVSVGAVMPASLLKGQDPDVALARCLEQAPRVRSRIQGSTLVFDQAQVEANFCYHCETVSGSGFFLVGDAACFVDPMLSGGVYLAVLTGIKAAEAVDALLQGNDEAETHSFFDNFSKTGYDTYFRMMYAFYEECSANLYCLLGEMAGGLPFTLQTAAGDYWGQADQPVLAYLRSKPQWQTFEEPFELVHGCPLYPNAFFRAAYADSALTKRAG